MLIFMDVFWMNISILLTAIKYMWLDTIADSYT